MTHSEIERYAAEKTHKTLDDKYNAGREHCIKGYTWTSEAEYFMVVENIAEKDLKE